MGYTHYFEFTIPKGIPAAKVEALYQRALIDCARIVKAWQRECADWERLSGYTAHTPIGAYGGLEFNGKADGGHEPFTLREHFRQNIDDGARYVKTARKPYDTVVTACLAVLKHRLGDAIRLSSDGYRDDWADGIALARAATRLKVSNPMQAKVWRPRQHADAHRNG